MKRWLRWGLLAILGFLVGLVVVWLWPRVTKLEQPPANKEPTFAQATVVSWQPETATLVYTDDKGAEQRLVIEPLRPMVIVPIFSEGKLVREELTLTSQAQYWTTAFCPKDKLQFAYDETGMLTSVRNQGPRSCK